MRPWCGEKGRSAFDEASTMILEYHGQSAAGKVTMGTGAGNSKQGHVVVREGSKFNEVVC